MELRELLIKIINRGVVIQLQHGQMEIIIYGYLEEMVSTNQPAIRI